MTTPSIPVPRGRERSWTPATDEAPAGLRRESSWLLQAVTGAAVLVLVTIHMVANHFVVPEGLRNFAQVVDYLSSPVIVVIEVLFLVTVTWHGLLGLRAVLFDFGFRPAVERRITRILAVVGVLTVGYGLWVTSVIVSHT
jgi:succinate dehydrogenase / fumarate reductase, membrane anchor subunit